MATAQGSIRIPLVRQGEDGEDSISFVPDTYMVTFTEDVNEVAVTFRAYQGETMVTIATMSFGGSVAGVTPNRNPNTDGSYTIIFTRDDPSVDVDASVDFTGTINGGTIPGSVQRTVTLRFLSAVQGEDGESTFDIDIDPPYVFFTEGVTVINLTAKVYYGSEVLDYYDGMQSAAWSGLPDGVAVTRVSQGSGIVNYRFTRTSADTEVDGTATLGLTAAPSGTGISVDLTRTIKVTSIPLPLRLDYNPNMVFGPDDTALSQTLTIYRGDTALTATAVQNSTSLNDKATLRGSVNSDGTVAVTVQRTSTSVEINEGESHAFQVATSNGESITVPFMVYAIKNGDPGPEGDPGPDGVDAVAYELQCAYSTVKFNGAAQAFAPESINVALYQVKGTDRALYDGNVAWTLFAEYVGDVDSSNKQVQREVDTSDGNTWTIMLAQYVGKAYGTGYYSRLLVQSIAAGEQLQHSVEVTWSAMPRIQVWDDCSDTFQFESGQAGEQFMDFVYYDSGNGAGNMMYQCILSHVKNEGEAPTYNTTTRWWQPVNTFDNVATQVLLATTAKIENLYVDDVFMSNNETALWLNPAIEGLKIVKKSMLVGDGTREEQTATGAAWSNPTAWFSAGKNPTVAEMFSGGGVEATGVSVALAASMYNPVADHDDGGWASPEDQVLAYTQISGSFPQNSFVTIHQSQVGANNFKMQEGIIAGDRVVSDPERYKSLLYFELRYSNLPEGGDYVVIAKCHVGTSDGSDPDQPYSYGDFGAIPDMTFYDEWSAGVRFLQIAIPWSAWEMGNIGFRYNGSTSTQAKIGRGGSASSTSYTAHQFTISSNPTGYVARYTAEGVFLGLTANSYARFALSDSEVSHALMAKGNGIVIDEGCVLQRQAHDAAYGVPPGATLLTAYLELNRTGQIRGKIWTWDGTEPTRITYSSTGVWAVVLPYATWQNYIGPLSSENIGAVATTVGDGYACVRDLVDNQIVLRIYNGSGDLTDDRPVFLQVFYIGENAHEMYS